MAGVPLATAQKLARHSTPELTANVYTHVAVGEKARAINALPVPVLSGAANGSELADLVAPQLTYGPPADAWRCTTSHGTPESVVLRVGAQPVNMEGLSTSMHVCAQRARRDSNPQPSVPKFAQVS